MAAVGGLRADRVAARTRRTTTGLAVFGALTTIIALAALFLGVMLAD